MTDKTYEITFEMSDGTEKSVTFTVPQGGGGGGTGESGADGVGIDDITISNADGSGQYTLTFHMSDGTTRSVRFTAPKGADGKDGVGIVDAALVEVAASYSVTFRGAFEYLSGNDVYGHFEVNGEDFDFYAHAGYDPDDWDDNGLPPVTVDYVETLAIVADRECWVVYKGLESGEEKEWHLHNGGGRLEISLTEDIEIIDIYK